MDNYILMDSLLVKFNDLLTARFEAEQRLDKVNKALHMVSDMIDNLNDKIKNEKLNQESNDILPED